MITINSHKGQMLELKVSGEKFNQGVTFIKRKLLGRVYNPDTKFWEIPILKTNFELLKKEKTFEDADTISTFEDVDFATYLTATKEGDQIKIKFYYDDKIIDIIKKKKEKDDKWDGDAGVWTVSEKTWKAVSQPISNYLKKLDEKFVINI